MAAGGPTRGGRTTAPCQPPRWVATVRRLRTDRWRPTKVTLTFPQAALHAPNRDPQAGRRGVEAGSEHALRRDTPAPHHGLQPRQSAVPRGTHATCARRRATHRGAAPRFGLTFAPQRGNSHSYSARDRFALLQRAEARSECNVAGGMARGSGQAATPARGRTLASTNDAPRAHAPRTRAQASDNGCSCERPRPSFLPLWRERPVQGG